MKDVEKIFEKYNKYESEKGWELSKREDFTCSRCDRDESCEYAWDLYNTNGDCLAEK